MKLFSNKIERIMRLSYCLYEYSLVEKNVRIVVAVAVVVVEAVKEGRKTVKRQSIKQK